MAAPKKASSTHVTFTPLSGGSVMLPKVALCISQDPITDVYRVFLADGSKDFWRVSEETASSITEEMNP
ncbi:hypothetical protein HOT15_gp07 [Dickeya phage Dagda]|uniref:Uncharacterized protein n=2 Tax=Aarhusvirus dagda TaxID=2732762 RepID=A0A346NSV7_9CAUD|nr:hypothetical protein HOT15_gp07 [Dickeya phage Dagda]AXR70221.1 hypothetical protein [Dickeya phage Dagda]AXY81611.1 hypothetical protein [Dickeya phage Dagda_B1]